MDELFNEIMSTLEAEGIDVEQWTAETFLDFCLRYVSANIDDVIDFLRED